MLIERLKEVWHSTEAEEPFWKWLLPEILIFWTATTIVTAILDPHMAPHPGERLVITGILSLALFAPYLLLRHAAYELGAENALAGEDRLPHVAPESAARTRTLNESGLIARLDATARHRLNRRIDEFLKHVHFEACGGAELDDRTTLLVAAQASMMALNLPMGTFARIRSVLVYPSAYRAHGFSWTPSAETPESTGRLGESWSSGTVVLALDHLTPIQRPGGSTENLIVHELAHQLDGAGGRVDGVPSVASTLQATRLRRALEAGFARHCREVREGRHGVLDAYGAENPVEFFAVASEAFFEQPVKLRHQYGDLYAHLANYYRQDPAAMLEPA